MQIAFMIFKADFITLKSFTKGKVMEYWLHGLNLNERILSYLMTHNDTIFIKIVSQQMVNL